jgi:hypothetical protein
MRFSDRIGPSIEMNLVFSGLDPVIRIFGDAAVHLYPAFGDKRPRRRS